MMTDMTHTDLHRDIGRMEGRLDGMDDRLSKIETIVERIDSKMAALEAAAQRNHGAWGVFEAIGITIVTLGAGIIGSIVAHFWK